MSKGGNLVGGLLAGAGLMYVLDPKRGRRRRAAVRDQMARTQHTVDDAVDTTRRDMQNRVHGAVARTRTRMDDQPVDDTILAERVRAELGRAVSHPHAITVSVRDGTVTLSGPILAKESARLLSAARSIRGVRDVTDRLDVHENADDIPSLQGGRERRGRRPEVLQEYWAPTARLLVGLAGGALALASTRGRGPVRALGGLAGLGLVTRAATNLETKRLTGVRAGRRAIDIQKSINVNAPVEEVFEFWSHFENFPRFMSHLREVRRISDQRSRWIAAGPVGTTPEWEADVIEWVPNQVIRWRSVKGSTIGTEGWVRFQPNPAGGTRIDVHLSYNPPAGAIGHALASLFGADPKHAMDDDLIRFKSLIEQGKTSAPGRRVTREELRGTSG